MMFISIIVWLIFVMSLSIIVFTIMFYILNLFIEDKYNKTHVNNIDINSPALLPQRDRTGLFIFLTIFIIVLLTTGTMALIENEVI